MSAFQPSDYLASPFLLLLPSIILTVFASPIRRPHYFILSQDISLRAISLLSFAFPFPDSNSRASVVPPVLDSSSLHGQIAHSIFLNHSRKTTLRILHLNNHFSTVTEDETVLGSDQGAPDTSSDPTQDQAYYNFQLSATHLLLIKTGLRFLEGVL